MIASGCNTFTVFWKWCIKSKYSKFRLDGVTLQLLLNITIAVLIHTLNVGRQPTGFAKLAWNVLKLINI